MKFSLLSDQRPANALASRDSISDRINEIICVLLDRVRFVAYMNLGQREYNIVE